MAVVVLDRCVEPPDAPEVPLCARSAVVGHVEAWDTHPSLNVVAVRLKSLDEATTAAKERKNGSAIKPSGAIAVRRTLATKPRAMQPAGRMSADQSKPTTWKTSIHFVKYSGSVTE